MLRSIIKQWGLMAFAITMIMACQTQETKTVEKEPVDESLPALTLQHLNGSSTDLTSFKGKKVLVNLWASWCGPCRAEMPSIEQLAASIDTSKAAILLISLDEDAADAKKFMQGKALANYSYLPLGDMPDLLSVPGIPASFFFDENGLLIKKVVGQEDYNTPAMKALLQ